jgi:hypothetical protein
MMGECIICKECHILYKTIVGLVCMRCIDKKLEEVEKITIQQEANTTRGKEWI